MKEIEMLSRRSLIFAAIAVTAGFAVPSLATETRIFDQKTFAEAQKAGRPIFVGIHASWCSTCKAQDPILGELMAAPKFKDLVYFVIDFDGQKDAVKLFGVRVQSTLIAFKGEKETGSHRTNPNFVSISSMDQ
jgi:thioredoxin 1